MVAPQAVIDEARAWLGTPYQHQARLKGVGVDCAGLLIGVARELGIADVHVAGYGPVPHAGMLRATVEQHCIRIDAPEPACVLLMGWLPGPEGEQHLAILTDADTIVHAYAHAQACVEHRYSSAWRARTRGYYRMPGVAPWQS